MTGLPAKLAEPLHIIPEWILIVFTIFKWIFIFAIILIIIFFIYRYIQKKKIVNNDSSVRHVSKGFEVNIASIKKRVLEEKDYRKGCFLLSNELKTYMEKKTNINVEEMTIHEIRTKFKSKNIGKFFENLRELQYQKKEPNVTDFHYIADNSYSVTRSKLKKR